MQCQIFRHVLDIFLASESNIIYHHKSLNIASTSCWFVDLTCPHLDLRRRSNLFGNAVRCSAVCISIRSSTRQQNLLLSCVHVMSWYAMIQHNPLAPIAFLFHQNHKPITPLIQIHYKISVAASHGCTTNSQSFNLSSGWLKVWLVQIQTLGSQKLYLSRTSEPMLRPSCHFSHFILETGHFFAFYGLVKEPTKLWPPKNL